MSHQRPQNAQAGPNRPLIQRPQHANANNHSNSARSAFAVSPLSHAIHGALGGMGYRAPPAGPCMVQPSFPAAMSMALPASMSMGMPNSAGLAMAPHHYPPQPQAPYGYPPQAQYGSLPAPPIHPNHHPLPMNPQWYHQQPTPPPSNHPANYLGSSQGARPRTTNEGYTISSTYQAPSPALSTSKPIPKRPPTTNANPHSNPRPTANSSRAATGAPPPPRPATTRSLAASHPSAQSSYPCGLEGCSFKSNTRKVTREHEEDRHLMFEKGREPKPWKGTYQSGARIEGTSLSLDSPEAVAAWIEQRKQRWPSSKVVEEKEKQRDERIKAGLERPRNEYGAGWRGGGGRGRGADGGRGRGAANGSGRGGGRLHDRHEAKRVKVEGSNESSSSDSGSDSSASTSDSDEDSSDDDDDDGPPEEMSTTGPKMGKEGQGDPVRREFVPRIPCRHFLRGRCAAGDACTFLHAAPPEGTPPPPTLKNGRKRPHPASSTPYNPFARSDPFAQLAERDWKHLVSDVLQVVQFLADNEWLKGVEIRRGEIEEQGGIEEVQTGVVVDGSGEKVDGEDTEFPLEGQLDEQGEIKYSRSPPRTLADEVTRVDDDVEIREG
ncbi:BQ2448_764 [Microbotryum intermedium]|uniref:BQ2448_764 protein n=1 Tax=Microbotryum intermedium TaxID=269621 RepID=A0A238F9E8_9BASI|nr:BQ2448_764 [Microbotryum intermedium]